MFDYLLAEKNFVSIRQYKDFLNDLGPALAQIQSFSDLIARQGHQLLVPPDARALGFAAKDSLASWQGIKASIDALGHAIPWVVQDLNVFLAEFAAINDEGWDRRTSIVRIDPQRFSIVTSGNWTGSPPVDVLDIMQMFLFRLGMCERTVEQLRTSVRTLTENTHGLFLRFIESLKLRLCSCDGPISKIEAYYTLGRLGLPGMQYDPNDSYSEEQRRELAKQHIVHLETLHAQSTGSANNLGDFCFRLMRFIEDARRELLSNHDLQTLPRAKLSMRMMDYSLTEVREMSTQLTIMARKLNA
ncbi:hypothetical protein BK666_31240 [Pseudomonas frederiksbergensis]|uniref:Uncharacterized protein n=1 Tax=Pseudomonas frederiksbergensis TaxID=104087 RepID=A0A423JJ63_9PSED|nr:hypothetical protein [Pseudomonas frederiksbergensis]RON37703.1 hypothetical protein BK666_31240 [Pseudomonas frederiksbergensis]